MAAKLAVPAVGAKVIPADVPITAAAAAAETPTPLRIGNKATKSSMAKPAADGIISEEEKPELKEILEYLDELSKTISELKTIGSIALNGGRADGEPE